VSSAGNNQTGLPGAPLSQQLQVLVHEDGAPLAGVAVTWMVTAGGGTVQPVSTTTDANGHATAVWILGPTLGTNTVKATSTEVDGEATFTAQAVEEPGAILVAEVPIPANYGIHDTFVRDGIAFVAAWNSGIRIYDVGGGSLGGSPGSPQLIGQYTPPSGGVPGGAQVHNSWWFHNPVTLEKKYLFVGQEGPYTQFGLDASGDLKVFDVSNLSAPIEVATLRIVGAGVHNFWMDEARQILYAAWYNGGVVAVDVSGTLTGNLASRIIGQAFPGGEGAAYTWGVMLSGGLLYASDMRNGFYAIDPETMTPLHTTPNVTNRFTSDLWVHGNVAYTGTWGNRTAQGNAINIWTVGGDAAPTFVRAIELLGVGTVSDIAVTPDGELLVATAESGSGNGLHLYGRSDPLNPTALTQVTVPQGLHTGEVAVINGRTYVFAARNPPSPALMVFDITDVNP
jgi:hypothetical protein